MNIKSTVELPFGKKIYQYKSGQSVSSDVEFIVKTICHRFRNNTKNLNVLDLGCGGGIISIMLAHHFPLWNVSGIDIQDHLVEIAKENAILAEVDVTFIKTDIRNYVSAPKCNLIISNPPYFTKNSGRISPSKERAISRYEIMCCMEDMLEAVKRNLLPNGKAYILYPLFRKEDLEKFIKKVDLIITKKIIQNNLNKKKIFIAELIHA